MSPYPECFDHMLAAWNETDPALIRDHLERGLATDVRFVDPTIVTDGLDEFEANVREFRATWPDARCYRTSGFDSHHDMYRYNWAIDAAGQTIITGFDVVELNDRQRVRTVRGFFGPLPAIDA